MTTDLMEKIRKSFSHDARPEIPLAKPESRSNSVSSPAEEKPRVHFKGWNSASSQATSPSRDVLDAAHSTPSVLSQHIGPPVIEHKYPRDSKWRRHSITEQERHYLR